MKLTKLIESCDVKGIFGEKNINIKNVIDNSNNINKGSLFVAIKGIHFDSHEKIDEVIKKGAVCVVGERKPRKEWIEKITYVQVVNSKEALGIICSNWFDNPSKKLKIIGVTGTDGKTTTSSMIYSVLNFAKKKVGLVTSVSAKIHGRDYDTGFHVTNPEQYELHKFLAEMVSEGCEYAVLEVTSHGIKQKRIYGIHFDASVITNITPEHLDYHRTFKDYKNTKIGFLLSTDNIVANIDDKSFKDIKKKVKKQKLISYGLNTKADLYANKIEETKDGENFTVHSNTDNYKINSQFFGVYNIYNSLAAIGVLTFLGVEVEEIEKALSVFRLPEGRLQKVDVKKTFEVYVDFAHTPNALEETLKIFKKKSKGKIISILGCAGERDKKKRKKMGQIATKYSDFSIFTAEDPRSEDVFKILSVMKQGALKNNAKEIHFGVENNNFIFDRNKRYFAIVPERHEAVAFALFDIAQRNDTVIFFGKGHEKTLAYAKFEHPWSDQEIVKNVLSDGKNIAAIILAAGRGTRMVSTTPKVLRKICGRPMISYTLENLRRAAFRNIVVVVGYKKDLVIKEACGSSRFALQEKTLGTANAAAQGLKKINEGIDTVVVMNGDDSAFYKPKTIKEIVKSHYETKSVVSFVSLLKEKPAGLGRVVRNSKGELVSIIEEREATKKQKGIKEVNDGLYVFNKDWLERNIWKVRKSSVGEYYIVDLIKLALEQKKKVNVFRLANSNEWQGINTPDQLKEANKKMIKRLSKWN